jgi:hypothetical protein
MTVTSEEQVTLELPTQRVAERLLDLLLRVNPSEVLNSGAAADRISDPGRALQETANAMRSEAIDSNTGQVDYERLAQSEAYSQFRQLTLSLPHCSKEDLGEGKHQLAFWINVYNALILDAVLHYSVTGSLLSDLGFFRRAAYNIGGYRLSADDIEHGILRGNRRHPYLPFAPFSEGDPRKGMLIRRFDPRVHFALVCGAKSCPPISFYDGDRIEEQLDQAARTFIRSGGIRLDAERETIWLSKIFQWYRADFGGRNGVLEVVSKHLREDDAGSVSNLRHLRIRYLPYDWSVNAKA